MLLKLEVLVKSECLSTYVREQKAGFYQVLLTKRFFFKIMFGSRRFSLFETSPRSQTGEIFRHYSHPTGKLESSTKFITYEVYPKASLTVGHQQREPVLH